MPCASVETERTHSDQSGRHDGAFRTHLNMIFVRQNRGARRASQPISKEAEPEKLG
jgi:hypothetical protein